MFVLVYFNEKKEIVDSKVGLYNELRAEVEKGINEGSKHYKAMISRINGKTYLLGDVKTEEPKKKRGRPAVNG